jgi:hypothetical protein
MSNPDRRSALRKPLYVPVAVHPAQGAAVQARMLDISRHGMSVVAAANLDSNMTCHVVFTLPGRDAHQHAMKLPARIVYSVLSMDGFKIGLHFVGPDHTTGRHRTPLVSMAMIGAGHGVR